MALSLGVKKDDEIKIGGRAIRDTEGVVVRVEGGKTVRVEAVSGVDSIHLDVEGKKYVVTNATRTEILPNIFVQSGRDESAYASHSTNQYTRLCFEAPRAVTINRVPRKKVLRA